MPTPTTSSQTSFLSVDSISASYNKNSPIIENISFNLQSGELGCLLGPSGCGKTTILKAISGFQQISTGEITLDGLPLTTPKKIVEPEKRNIGMVFQDHSLFPHLTISENIEFGLLSQIKPKRLSIVNTMLDLIGMVEHAEKYPHELSGGQSQRVALARAIAPRPKLLLMDEPFSNLDAELRTSLGNEVRLLLKELNITTIMVTHDQNDAFALGDQVGVMSDGHLLQWDSSFNLYHAPSSRLVANFIGDGVFVKGKMINDHVVVTNIGEIRGESINSQFVGKEIDLLIRPDDVKHNVNSAIKGIVIRKVFKGAQTLYTLKTESGVELMSLVPSHDDFEVGDTIGVSIETDHLVCFEQI